jgi:uncharacterized membrane protein
MRQFGNLIVTLFFIIIIIIIIIIVISLGETAKEEGDVEDTTGPS